MAYKIISLVDGSTKSCDLVNLSQSLSLNCEVLREVDGSHEAVGFVNHETLVFFAVEFADYALNNYTKQKSQETESCITLTRKWLKAHDAVSNEELRAAANVAYAADAAASVAANAAAYAAVNAAAYAADATNAYAAVYAAAYAVNAAHAAVYAADTDAYAAHADAATAAYATAAKKSKKKEKERQGNFILSYFNTSVV